MVEVTLPVPEISEVDAVFPSRALEWMPPWEEIPDEFRRQETEWNKIASTWFASGLSADTEFIPKPGVEPHMALRVVKATLGSYAPGYEHKLAAVAYMMCCWFERIEKWDNFVQFHGPS